MITEKKAKLRPVSREHILDCYAGPFYYKIFDQYGNYQEDNYLLNPSIEEIAECSDIAIKNAIEYKKMSPHSTNSSISTIALPLENGDTIAIVAQTFNGDSEVLAAKLASLFTIWNKSNYRDLFDEYGYATYVHLCNILGEMPMDMHNTRRYAMH